MRVRLNATNTSGPVREAGFLLDRQRRSEVCVETKGSGMML